MLIYPRIQACINPSVSLEALDQNIIYLVYTFSRITLLPWPVFEFVSSVVLYIHVNIRNTLEVLKRVVIEAVKWRSVSVGNT